MALRKEFVAIMGLARVAILATADMSIKYRNLHTGSKRCRRCHRQRPRLLFRAYSRSADGLDYLCKICRGNLSKKWHREHPGYWRTRLAYRIEWNRKNKHKRRTYKLRYRYGTTAEARELKLKRQRNRCAICGRKHAKRWRGWHSDHPHKGKKRLRGILCRGCNWGLGHFGDSARLLLKAAKYIQTK